MAGAVTIILVLALVAFGYWALNLSNKLQALALPEGSIRKVIALLLIAIFVVISLFLVGNLASSRAVAFEKLTADAMPRFLQPSFLTGRPSLLPDYADYT